MNKEMEKTITLDKEAEKELEKRIKLHSKLANGYIHKSGIKVRATFKEDGVDLTECWSRILKEKLRE